MRAEKSNQGFDGLISRAVLLFVFVFIAMVACGEQGAVDSDDEDTSLTPREQRIEAFLDLDLEPGEALDGIHLMPWIEVFEVDKSVHGPLVSDVEYLHDPEEASRNRITKLTFHGELVDEFTKHEGLLPDDLIVGSDFLVIVGEAEKVGDTIEVETAPFDIGRLFHGDWDFSLEDAIINRPQDGDHSQDIQDADDRQDLIRDMYQASGQAGVTVDDTNMLSTSLTGISGIDLDHFVDNAELTGGVEMGGEAKFKGRISISGVEEDLDQYERTASPDAGVCERSFSSYAIEAVAGLYVCIQEVAVWLEVDADYLLESEFKYVDTLAVSTKLDLFEFIGDAQFPVGGGLISVTVEPFFELLISLAVSNEYIYDVATGIQESFKIGYDYDAYRTNGDSLLVFPLSQGYRPTGLRHEDAYFERKTDFNELGGAAGLETKKVGGGFRLGIGTGLAITGSNSLVEASVSGFDIHAGVSWEEKGRFVNNATYYHDDCFQNQGGINLGVELGLEGKLKLGPVGVSGQPQLLDIFTDWANGWTNGTIPLWGDPHPADAAHYPNYGDFPPKCDGLGWRVPDTHSVMIHSDADTYTNQDVKEYLFADDPRPLMTEDVNSEDALLRPLDPNFDSYGRLALVRDYASDIHWISWENGVDLRQFEMAEYSGDKEVFYLVLHNTKEQGAAGPMEFTVFPAYTNPIIGGRPTFKSFEHNFFLEPGEKEVIEIEFKQFEYGG